MKPKSRIAALAAAAVLGLGSQIAHATLFIGLQQDGAPTIPILVASDTDGFIAFSGSFGQFENVAIAASGQPGSVLPLLLQVTGNVQNAAGAADAGTLGIYVTSTGNTGPIGANQFTSGFAAVSLSGWTQTQKTYLDPGNGIFTLVQPLGSATLAPVDSEVDNAIRDAGTGPYSVTAVFTIAAPSLGGATASAQLAVSPVPEPSAWLLMLMALGFVGWKARRTASS